MLKRKMISILLFIIGLSIFTYPIISNYYNKQKQMSIMNQYIESINHVDFEKEWEKVKKYNQNLLSQNIHDLLKDNISEYEDILNISGNGVIGIIEIPKINVKLPIYHGTSDEVLKTGIGHIKGTSLPDTEINTHCVLSGHRGLPSSKLFSDLDQLEICDQFSLQILNKELTYQIDQISIVKPEEIDSLQIETGKNYITLVTCTPYGINTHRLLVRGELLSEKDIEI